MRHGIRPIRDKLRVTIFFALVAERLVDPCSEPMPEVEAVEITPRLSQGRVEIVVTRDKLRAVSAAMMLGQRFRDGGFACAFVDVSLVHRGCKSMDLYEDRAGRADAVRPVFAVDVCEGRDVALNVLAAPNPGQLYIESQEQRLRFLELRGVIGQLMDMGEEKERRTKSIHFSKTEGAQCSTSLIHFSRMITFFDPAYAFK